MHSKHLGKYLCDTSLVKVNFIFRVFPNIITFAATSNDIPFGISFHMDGDELNDIYMMY